MTLTPFVGSTETVHVTTDAVVLGKNGHPVKSLCNRTVTPSGYWQPEAWTGMVEKWERLHKTHKVFACGRCVKASKV